MIRQRPNARDVRSALMVVLKLTLQIALLLCPTIQRNGQWRRICPRSDDAQLVSRLALKKESAMKVIISALLALSVFAGIAAPASADYNPREDAGQRSPL
jgi:hypothetical protein